MSPGDIWRYKNIYIIIVQKTDDTFISIVIQSSKKLCQFGINIKNYDRMRLDRSGSCEHYSF